MGLGRSLLIVFLPSTLIVGLKVSGVPLPPPIEAWGGAAAVLWTVVALLAQIDPRFGEKLSAFKELPKLSQLGRKDHGKDGGL
jgi:hypothetical protein